MKRWLTALMAVVLLCGISVVSLAKNTPDTVSGAKFGYVDFARAMNEVNEGKQAKATLEKEFAQKQKKLELMQKELQAKQQELEKQRMILSPDAMKKKEEAFRRKFIDINQKLGQFKEEMAKREFTLTSNILNKLRRIVSKIGSKENYTMILEKSQVIYSPAGTDLTDRVIRDYNGNK
jgi:outer membrane protein